ncbi:MAG: four helix bundle protein [Flavisolibacter sp.]
MRDYKKLDVWKKAHTTYLYVKKNVTSKFPKEERFELTAQANRAALSIPLNIVEGCGRLSDKDFAHFLDTALGSTNEVDYCCYAALELNYISEGDYQSINNLINEVRAMLISFLRFLRKN